MTNTNLDDHNHKLPYTFKDFITRSISSDLHANLSFEDAVSLSHVNKIQRELINSHFKKLKAASRQDQMRDGYSSMKWGFAPRKLWSEAETLDAHVQDCHRSSSMRIFTSNNLIILCPSFKSANEHHPVLVYKDKIYQGRLRRQLRGRVDGIQFYGGHIFIASSERHQLEVFCKDTLEDVTADYRREKLRHFENNDSRYMLEALPGGFIVQFRRIESQLWDDSMRIAMYNLQTGTYQVFVCGFGHQCSDEAYSNILECYYGGGLMDLSCPNHGPFVFFCKDGHGAPNWSARLDFKAHQRAFMESTSYKSFGYIFRDNHLVLMRDNIPINRGKIDFFCNPSVPAVKTDKLIIFSVLTEKIREPKPRIVILCRSSTAERVNETHVLFQNLKGIISNLQLIKTRFLVIEVSNNAEKTVISMDLIAYMPQRQVIKETYEKGIFKKFLEFPGTKFYSDYTTLGASKVFTVVGVSNEEELIMTHKGSKLIKLIK